MIIVILGNMRNGTLHHCFSKAKMLLERGDRNRARDYCDMGIGYVALQKEKGMDGEELIENVKINLWLERFWMFLENNKLML
tara:strand:+ start:398 stop:643 length:246 start_codon:yes stop_codon:yes gene_type:complete